VIELVVENAGPLIHLDQLKCLDLLSDFLTLLVPDVVWNEILKYRPHALPQSFATLVPAASGSRRQQVPLPDLVLGQLELGISRGVGRRWRARAGHGSGCGTLILVDSGQDPPPTELHVTTNWLEELKRLAPPSR
jgi:hypothetical protein